MLFSAKAPLTGEFFADNDLIIAGEAVTLRWTTDGATSVTIDNGIGSVTPVAAGSVSVSPSVSTTYTMTIAGPGGTLQKQFTASVSIVNSVTNFRLQNWGSGTSKGFAFIGCPFKAGDVPIGSSIAVRCNGATVPSQFDSRRTYSGSLRLAALTLRDSDFSAGEERTYDLVLVPDTAFDNTGTLSLSDVTNVHDYKVVFTNVKRISDGTTYGPGTFTASLRNFAAGRGSRVTKWLSGPICEAWETWGLAAGSGGTQDANLKVYIDVTAYKDADGNIVDTKIAANPELSWFNLENLSGYLNGTEKAGLTYNAALYDGDAELASNFYSTDIPTNSLVYATSNMGYVEHPYKSGWLLCHNADDDNCGKPIWRSGNIPTLNYKPNKAYWISANFVPPLDLTLTPNAHTVSQPGIASRQAFQTYNPCSPQDHRASIDGTGNYQGRGLLSNVDCLTFLRQGSNDARYTRLNGLVGLHVPFQVRSNFLGSKPGFTADISNSLCPLKFRQLTDGSDDFTSLGLPARMHAYVFGVSGTTLATDGVTKAYVAPSGGTGSWGSASNGSNSHAISYSYFAYLMEPERHFLRATLNLAQKAVQDGRGNSLDKCPGYTYYQKSGSGSYASLNIPNITGTGAVQYSGICVNGNTNFRAVGWGLLNITRAQIICPDDDIHSGYINLMAAQQASFLKNNLPYLPAKQKLTGAYGYMPGAEWMNSPWMQNFICLAAAESYLHTGDANMKSFIDEIMQYTPISFWEGTDWYRSDDYREQLLPKGRSEWDTSTNDIFDRSGIYGMTTAHVNLATGVLTFDGANFYMRPTDNDPVWLCDYTDNPSNITLPTGLSVGVQYYLRDSNATARTAKLCTSPGGTAVVPGGSGTALIGIAVKWASYVQSVESSTYHLSASSDAYAMIARAAVIHMKKAGASLVTDTHVANAKTFTAPNERNNWVTWWHV